MNRIDIDLETLIESKRGSLGTLLDKQGHTSIAIRNKDNLIKIDKELLTRIGLFGIKLDKDLKAYNNRKIELLNHLDSIRDNFKLIDLPHTEIYCNNVLVGTIGKYYEDSKDILKIMYLDEIERQRKVIEALDIFRELELNKIVYVDIHTGNFLLVNNNVKLIDIDDPTFVRIRLYDNEIGMVYRRLFGTIIMNFILNKTRKIMVTYEYEDLLEFLYQNVDYTLRPEIDKRFKIATEEKRKQLIK